MQYITRHKHKGEPLVLPDIFKATQFIVYMAFKTQEEEAGKREEFTLSPSVLAIQLLAQFEINTLDQMGQMLIDMRKLDNSFDAAGNLEQIPGFTRERQ